MQRDLYIDFAKGIATLSVIFIHTVFWSGQYYVPTEVRIFSLLVDVPLFFALSGLTSGGKVEKTLNRLLRLQITFMLFVTLLFFLDYIIKVLGISIYGQENLRELYHTFGSKYVPKNLTLEPAWQNLGNWYVHSYTNADSFPVVMGSFWYLKVYFILTVFGVLILRFFPKHIDYFILLCILLTLLFYFYPNYYPTGQVGYVTTYLAIFLLAARLKGKKLSNRAMLLCSIIGLGLFVWLFSTYGAEIFFKINKQKFPPKVPYIIWILPSILLLFALYGRLKINKQNLFTYIGQNAIFYYFAQGISSTIIYFIVTPLKDSIHWVALLLIAFVINVILAIIIAEALKKFDSWGWKALYYLKAKAARN